MNENGDISKPKAGWGGARAGAGRKKPSIPAIDLKAAVEAPPPEEIDAVAQQHARTAIDALVKLLMHASSEAAKITASKEILDRGYGKPAVEIGGDAALLPFMMVPTQSAVTLSAEIRTEARKFANLAVEVLRKIADGGKSESARASASKALLDRGLGTVAAARMPDEMRVRPMGKKEEAAQAAKAAATGRYATPRPPRAATETMP